jgi:hypothetical protein
LRASSVMGRGSGRAAQAAKSADTVARVRMDSAPQ